MKRRNVMIKVVSAMLVLTSLFKMSSVMVLADDTAHMGTLLVSSEVKAKVEVVGDNIIITIDDTQFIEKMTGVKVNDDQLSKVSSGMFDWLSSKRYAIEGNIIKIAGIKDLESDVICTIQADGYDDVIVHTKGDLSTIIPSTPSIETNKLPEPEMKILGQDIILSFKEEDEAYLKQLKGVYVSGTQVEKVSSILFDWVSGSRFKLDKNIMTISGLKNVSKDTVVTLIANGYDDINVKTKEDIQSSDGKVLHVRLRGSFEAAIINQKGYDALTSASMNVSQNKNSNVVVESALLEKNKAPTEDDWVLLKDSGLDIDFNKTNALLDDESGMKAVYNPYDSSLTLKGIPAKEGTYPISVNVVDTKGHASTSQPLYFKVYTGTEYLEDQLKLENCTQFQDETYKYDMEPWVIQNFEKAEDGRGTVIVPKGIKAWYGSHEEGTYGSLGYAIKVNEKTTQTLIIPDGCHLTLVNMDILSSVKIVVQKGGSLSLNGTPVQGVIEVQDGGVFSMNHDQNGFGRGSAINGQLILKDGATLKDSKIYSNTNYVPNGSNQGDYERINTNPVVVTEGNVNIEGTVVIKGDEAASYLGQTGLEVKGTLNIKEGSTLAVYGGGTKATTSIGAPAIVLTDGNITGEGKLIAVGGFGFHNNGGNAIEGSGTVSTKNIYLEGGQTTMPKNDFVKEGLSHTQNVKVSPKSNQALHIGKRILSSTDVQSDSQWSDITTMPDFTKYVIPENGMLESEKDNNQSKEPIVSDTNLTDESNNIIEPSVSKNETNKKTTSINTGDDLSFASLIVVMCLSMGLFILLVNTKF